VKLPRFFGKKRGHRRTGSQAWASLGDAAFHAALLAVGLVFGGLLLSGVAVPEWRMNHQFARTDGVIVGKGLVRRRVTAPTGTVASTWQPTILVRYTAADRTIESWSRSPRSTITADRAAAVERLSAWRLGADVPAWYDPSDPSVVVVQRGFNWWMWLVTLVLPGALVAFGGSGLLRAVVRWSTSEERRAVPGGLAGSLAPLTATPRQAPDHPGVPACDDHVNSPGTFLAYRLPIDSPESWALIGFGMFAALWNAVVVVLMVNAGIDLLGGRTDWLLLGLLVPFVAVGIAGIVVFARRLVIATAIGTTQVEIGGLPLRPGHSYEIVLAQGGTGTLESLELSLESEEQATFRLGTDTRTERLPVWRQPIGSWQQVQLSPGTRFEARVTATIPPTAMHSLSTEHNAVRWMLVVRGTPSRWPAFARTFPLVVFPPDLPPARRDAMAASGTA
jgi:hypothetical protein